MIRLDHFLILTEPGAPEGDLLVEFGLAEGSSNTHPGQGTANRRFFFDNTALELGYVRDADEAKSGPGRGLRMVERAASDTASPIGLIVKADDGSSAPPFSGWRYYPDYFDSDMYFLVGENSELLEEPFCCFMPFSYPPHVMQQKSPEPFNQVSEIRVGVPIERPSPVVEAVSACEGIQIETGQPHRLDVYFGDGAYGESNDFRPRLPLVFHW